ncbi:DmsC/YnfH family molybdoenzyme membrane anchor subunit [Photobacterium damselae]|uniref:DmsC/YnfH family molybdoenzyme membrane anchor subunit n=1 Tax=Photobacterium damselae TaxID=38293 RepID=UPI002543C769|nr:DmsC/YnfH family molybdoenzyme membrane anchor subunit [Photobacterium damselae]WIH21310.1 dimethyl sulfoxide reductase anchor subunit [Photobacterium damselae]
MHELPLVFFTVLAQTVAASFLLLQAFRFSPFNSYTMAKEKHKKIKTYLILLVLLGVSGIAAFTHLGSPLRAPNVLFGLAHLSAMSLEIITVSIFGSLIFSLIILTALNISNYLSKIINIFTTLFAILQLIAIANVYYLKTVYLWGTLWTWTNLIYSGFIPGSLLIALLINKSSKENSFSFKNLWCTILFISISLNIWYIFDLHAKLSTIGLTLPALIEWLLIIKNILIIISFIWCIRIDTKLNIRTYIIIVSLLITAELFGRIAFYELSLINSL